MGERNYGQQVPNQQPQGYGQQGGYGRQNAHYAAPETLPGGAPASPVRPPRAAAMGEAAAAPTTRGCSSARSPWSRWSSWASVSP
ncbi:hypothetical protein ACFQ2Y_22750 [Streptomyces malaysiensis subsp. malaysiensis]